MAVEGDEVNPLIEEMENAVQVLPVQWFVQNSHVDRGCILLLVGILRTAWWSILHGCNSRVYRQSEEFKEDYAWFMEVECADRPFSFEWVCDMLSAVGKAHFNAEMLRGVIRGFIEDHDRRRRARDSAGGISLDEQRAYTSAGGRQEPSSC